MKYINYLTPLIIPLLLLSCMDKDPFGFNTTAIVPPYELDQWEDETTYYLRGPSQIKETGWGAIEGTVIKLGWNAETILVYQRDDGQGGGWRIVDVKKNTISEIFSQDQIDQNASLKSLTIYTASDAWNRLK